MSEQIPQGIEVLVKKASVDPAFKELLLRDRAGPEKGPSLIVTAGFEKDRLKNRDNVTV